MKVQNRKIQSLLEKYKEIYLLSRINAVLQWDLNVNLPQKGSEGRAGQIAYITKSITEKWLDPVFRKTFENLDEKDKSYTPEEKAIIRNLKHASAFYLKVPKQVIIEFAETTSKAFVSWQLAKTKGLFADFLPDLKKVIEVTKLIAEHLGYKENKYDALLDLYEPGLNVKDCSNMFGHLQPELTNLIKKISSVSGDNNNPDLIGGSVRYPVSDQIRLSTFVLRKMNYDLGAGRMDVSSHPFTDTLGKYDVRITNRYKESDFRESLMVAMHETGHALYELGVSDDFEATPLDGGVSMGIHESQSRFWENQIGRSRAFARFMTPLFHAFYPEQLSGIGEDDFYRLFNTVKPSLIRVEADEVTYNLHLALRFELENGIVNEKIKAEDLPEVWRSKMKKYLGVVPEKDSEGVLQDIHWANGMFGYFPTYTLGNLYAAQFAKKMRGEIDVDKSIEKGELGTILSWLRTNIHTHGSLYWPRELCLKVTGEELNPKYFLDYIKEKYSKIYNL